MHARTFISKQTPSISIPVLIKKTKQKHVYTWIYVLCLLMRNTYTKNKKQNGMEWMDGRMDGYRRMDMMVEWMDKKDGWMDAQLDRSDDRWNGCGDDGD